MTSRMSDSAEIPIDLTTIQPMLVGGSDAFQQEFFGLLKDRSHAELRLQSADKEDTEWQTRRSPGVVWAVIALAPETENWFDETLRWTQLLQVAIRPNRLVVILPELRMDHQLRLLRAGADGFLAASSTAANVVQELEGNGIHREDYFPDPKNWLNSLTRASEELLISEDPRTQLTKLLRIFVSQLKVERCSILLLDKDVLRLAAAIGMPADLKIDTVINPHPHSITSWVLKNRRSRLIEGEYKFEGKDANRKGQIQSALCVPLIARDQLLGAVNFSSMVGGRMLTPTDLAAAEVFGSLLALSISNHRLHLKNLDSQRMATIGATTATVSHCIKNILVIFKGSIMLLKQGAKQQENSQVNSGISMVERAVKRLETLILDLLDFSKERPPQLSTINPAEFLDDLKSDFMHSVYHRGFTIEIDCKIDTPINIDTDRLQRALVNLINNSIEVMPDGGRILVRALVKEGKVIFSVSDEGPGVPESDLNSIFESFYSTKGSRGTGLGLAMVRKFCEENAGFATAGHCPSLGGLMISMELPYVPEVS